MARAIDARIDALFVEGPDDGAVVNAFVHKATGVDLSHRSTRLVRAGEAGGGDAWALRKFDEHVATAREGARIGVIVDRDTPENDKWPAVLNRLRRLGGASDSPSANGAIVGGCYGIWMWPDNVSHGALETFVAGIVPASAALAYATEASRIAKNDHGAEYDAAHAAKAALKVRSVWRDASAAGGYGHLVRNLQLVETSASKAFRDWFATLFLT
jgi:hypothetical protein